MSVAAIQTLLWEQIHALREGTTTPASANAISNAVGKIQKGWSLQIEYADSCGQTPMIPELQTWKARVVIEERASPVCTHLNASPDETGHCSRCGRLWPTYGPEMLPFP